MNHIRHQLTETAELKNGDILTEREAALLLRISRQTLVRIRNRKRIGYLRIGTQIRYLKSHLEDYSSSSSSSSSSSERAATP